MPGLDGMRALAVGAVVWHHTHAGIPYLPMTHNGFLGVDVFFVLSGFLITTLLLREKAESGRISLRHFYIRRSLRIFPLYYAVLAVLAIYFQFAAGGSNQRASFLGELPFHASYTSNWTEIKSMMAITWSLSTEEQFYLLWPPLLVFFGLSSPLLLSLFLVLNQAINFGWLDGYLAQAGIPYESLAILQCTFTPIILGALLAFAVASPRIRPWLDRVTAKGSVTVGLVLLLVAANIPGDIRGWPRLSFQLATVALLAAIVLHPGHRIVRALEWRPLVYVGAVSYGIYLLHMLVVDAAKRGLLKAGLPTDDLLFPLCLAGTIALAGLSYRYFELPILRLKDRFR
ncbi:MAG TPA: acyltransferase [Albitalea sp.]|nr:acyltransferase [Albitalea sp.]